MDIYYNPLDQRCKSVIGGIRQKETCTIKIFGESTEPCLLILKKDGHEAQPLRMQKILDGWQLDLKIEEPGLYFYHFKIGKREGGMDMFRNFTFETPLSEWQLLVSSADFSTPDWMKGGVMYQIFPDRFNRCGEVTVEDGKWLHKNWNEAPAYKPNANGRVLNNDFFGGNLRGIMEKLDHLCALGVTTLYLNPIFRAYSNHRYDTGDYLEVDPLLGTPEDFASFVESCKDRGIHIILDGVFNHTGDDSRYFNKYGHYSDVGAYQSKDSKYYAWYNFRSFPDKYDSWWGIDILPAINESCPSYIEFITGADGVLRHWIRNGISGWRLDVADELPDEFIELIRHAVKEEDPNAIVIGEVWEDASNKIAYSKRRRYFQGKELDSVMNYPLKNAIIHFVLSGNSDLFRQTIAMLQDNYPKCVLDCLMNILGTHDTVRILTALGGVILHDKDAMSVAKMDDVTLQKAKNRLKIASVLQFTVFGVPCIYYGDEIGMEGYTDPFCRFPFAWDNMDQELLEHYKKLSRIRKKYRVFKSGEYRELFADKNCVVFERRSYEEVVVIGVNFGTNRFDLKFDGTMYDLLEGHIYNAIYTLRGNTVCILGNKSIF